jgi:hypothetical protein
MDDVKELDKKFKWDLESLMDLSWDVPDDVFEDMLRASLRECFEYTTTAMWFPPPGSITPVFPPDPGAFDEEEKTDPGPGVEKQKTAEHQRRWKEKGLCPQCGHSGEWRALALFCPQHGKFAG